MRKPNLSSRQKLAFAASYSPPLQTQGEASNQSQGGSHIPCAPCDYSLASCIVLAMQSIGYRRPPLLLLPPLPRSSRPSVSSWRLPALHLLLPTPLTKKKNKEERRWKAFEILPPCNELAIIQSRFVVRDSFRDSCRAVPSRY